MRVKSYIFILIVCIIGCSRNNYFSFIQVSDPQLGFSEGNKSIDTELENLDKTISFINQKKPAFVIITGDITHDKGNENQIKAYFDHLSKIDKSIHVYHIPGNHDIFPPFDSTLEAYKSRFGEDYYAFKYGHVSFIGLNTSLIMDNIEPYKTIQYNWLENTLKKSKSDSIVIFMHCPIYLKSLDEKEEYFNFPKSERQKYLDLFAKSKVSVILSGHLHHNVNTTYDNFRMITTGPISKGLRNGKTGFALCRVNSNGMLSYNYILLDSLDFQD